MAALRRVAEFQDTEGMINKFFSPCWATRLLGLPKNFSADVGLKRYKVIAVDE